MQTERSETEDRGADAAPLAMHTLKPNAFGIDEFTCTDRGCMTSNRDEIALAAYFDPQNAKAAISIVKGDALDRAREVLHN